MRTKKIIVFALFAVMSLLTPIFSFTSFATGQPDLTITSAAVTSKTGTSISYTYTIQNTGSIPVQSLYNVSIQNLFSENTVFNDTGDVDAGESTLGVNRSLAPGESYTATFSATGAVPAGKDNLIFKIDSDDIITEDNENNNTFILSTLPGTTQMVSLRPEIEKRGIAVRDQSSRGVCVLESMTFLQEYLLSGIYAGGYNHLSIEYAIQAGNVATDSQSEDSYFRKFHMGYSTYGALMDVIWPFNPNYVYDYNTSNSIFSNLTYTGTALLEDGYRLAGKCIREGNYGTLTDAEIDTVIGYLDRGIPVAQAHSGHSTAIVGYELNSSYDGGGRFIYRNSWGNWWGDQGYGTYTFAELKQEDLGVALFVYESAPAFPKIYRDINYAGYNVALAPGTYTLEQLENIGVINDDISSIKIPSGYTAYLYEDDNFTGTCMTLTSDTDDFVNIDFNDTVSSIIITKN